MSDNIYGTMGSPRGDLSDAAEGESAADESPRQEDRSQYKTQMARSNIFLALLFVGGAAAVYGLSLRKGPEEASAEQQMVEAQVDSAIIRISQETATEIKTPSSGQITSRVLQNFYDQIAERQIPLRDLKKNPFVFTPSASAAPLAVKKPQKTAPRVKSPEEDTYEKAMAVFKTLHLQSVMMGRHGGTAIISNNLLTVGQKIEGFKIESIAPRTVVLVRQGRKFVLKMP